MLSKQGERQLDEMAAISEELGAIVPNNGWTPYARKILLRLQELSISLFGQSEVREDASIGEILAARKNTALPDDLTEQEKAQGYYFRTVNGNSIKFSSETGLPVDGQPKAFGAQDLQEMVDNALASIEAKREGKEPEEPEHRDRYSSPYPMEQISAEGENFPCKGFSEKNLQVHKEQRHPEQYANMTAEEYNEHAKKLLMKKCGPDIWGYRCSDGSICRFNRLTGEYAKGYPGGNIKTCFYPTRLNAADPTDIDLDFARNYYMARKEAEQYDR